MRTLAEARFKVYSSSKGTWRGGRGRTAVYRTHYLDAKDKSDAVTKAAQHYMKPNYVRTHGVWNLDDPADKARLVSLTNKKAGTKVTSQSTGYSRADDKMNKIMSAHFSGKRLKRKAEVMPLPGTYKAKGLFARLRSILSGKNPTNRIGKGRYAVHI